MSIGHAEYLLYLYWSRCEEPGCDCVKAQQPDVYYAALATLLAERAP